MADYTELVEELRYCVDGDEECASCKRWGQMACDVYLMEEAADAIEELSKPRWIPVTEKLPDVWSDVLVAVLKHRPKSEPVRTMAVDFITMTGEWANMNFDWRNEVTHWMPLPSTEGLNET